MAKKDSGSLPKSIWLFYIGTFLFGLTFFIPIWALYVQNSLGSVANVALIIAIQAATSVIFEVPTGAIGDLFGRKRTLLLGGFVWLCSLIFLYKGGSMTMFVLYAVFSALGGTLSSGTDNAFVYDTLKEAKMEHRYKKITGTVSALWFSGAVIGSLLGGYMAKTSLSLPVLMTMIPAGIALIFTLFLREPKYKKAEHKNVFRHSLSSSVDIIKSKQLILLFLTFGFVLYGLAESSHLLKPIFFEFKHIPVVYFGYIFALVMGLSALGHYFSHEISEKFGNKRTLLLSAVIEPLLVIIATFAFGLTSALILVIPSIFFGLRNPVVSHLINIETGSAKRATILSAFSMVQQLGKVAFAPFLGYLADLYSINTAYRIDAFLMFSVILLLMFIKDKN